MRAMIAWMTAGVVAVAAIFLFVRARDVAPEAGSLAAAQPAATVAASVAKPATETPAETSYVSPDFGYIVTFDNHAWSSSTSRGTSTMDGVPIIQDTLELRHDTIPGNLRLVGEAGWYGGSSAAMAECRDDLLLSFTVWDHLTPLATPAAGADDRRAWTQADFVIDGVPTTAYLECRSLGGDDVTLKVRQTAPAATFAGAAALREAVLAGLDLSGMASAPATPVATPLASPGGLATPQH